MRLAIALLPIVLLSCAPAPQFVDPTSPQALASCEARHGTVAVVGLSTIPSCLTPFSDAGRYCSDSTQCEGRCVVAGATPVLGSGRTVSGQCEFYHPTGSEECVLEVRGGRVAPGCASPKDPA